jgi:hypothetical protein
MASTIIQLTLIDEQLNDISVPLVFDSDINSYKGSVTVENFRFPLLVNLPKLEQLNAERNARYELMFSSNEKGLVKIFLHEENQKLYSSRYKFIRLNEKNIYELLYKNNCDEATLYFDGNNFDFIFQNDALGSSMIEKLVNFFTSMPAKLLYLTLLAYKSYQVIDWIQMLINASTTQAGRNGV